MRLAISTWRFATAKNLARFIAGRHVLRASLPPSSGPGDPLSRCQRSLCGACRRPPASCPSAVGLLHPRANFSGGIRGDFAVTATSFTPTADTPDHRRRSLHLATCTIHAQVAGKHGDLSLQERRHVSHRRCLGEIVVISSSSRRYRRAQLCRRIGPSAPAAHLIRPPEAG